MKIGFVGSRDALTQEQLIHVHMLLGDLQSAGATEVAHLGDTPAEVAFHEQATGFGYRVLGHPLDADVVIVAPAPCDPLWAFIERVRQAEKPLCILWPDGSTTVEGIGGVRTAEEWRQGVTP